MLSLLYFGLFRICGGHLWNAGIFYPFAISDRGGVGVKLEGLVKGGGVRVTNMGADLLYAAVCDPQQMLGGIDPGQHLLFLKADAVEGVYFSQHLPLGAVEQLGKIFLGAELRRCVHEKLVNYGHILQLLWVGNGGPGIRGAFLNGAQYPEHQLGKQIGKDFLVKQPVLLFDLSKDCCAQAFYGIIREKRQKSALAGKQLEKLCFVREKCGRQAAKGLCDRIGGMKYLRGDENSLASLQCQFCVVDEQAALSRQDDVQLIRCVIMASGLPEIDLPVRKLGPLQVGNQVTDGNFPVIYHFAHGQHLLVNIVDFADSLCQEGTAFFLKKQFLTQNCQNRT